MSNTLQTEYRLQYSDTNRLSCKRTNRQLNCRFLPSSRSLVVASAISIPTRTARMDSQPDSPLDSPFMLDDFTKNCQRLSASLPPDGWDPELPVVHVQRRDSGLLDFIVVGSVVEIIAGRHSAEVTAIGAKCKDEELLSLANGEGVGDASEDATRRPPKGCLGFLIRLCDYLRRWHTQSTKPSGSMSGSPKNISKRVWPFHNTDTDRNRRRMRKQRHLSWTETLLWEGF